MFEELFIAIATPPAPDRSSQACRVPGFNLGAALVLFSVRARVRSDARNMSQLPACSLARQLATAAGSREAAPVAFFPHGDERPDQTDGGAAPSGGRRQRLLTPASEIKPANVNLAELRLNLAAETRTEVSSATC